MIQITPYYRREDPEKTELLELFLSMISDIVPFLPEDVLAGTTATPSEKSKRAKNPRYTPQNLREAPAFPDAVRLNRGMICATVEPSKHAHDPMRRRRICYALHNRSGRQKSQQ